jgi:TonB family protein
VRSVNQPSNVLLPVIKINSTPSPFSIDELPLLAEAFRTSLGTRNLEVDPSQRREPRRVSEGVLLGNVINKVVPGYPPIAKQLRLSGEVKVDITISEEGRVIEAKAISGHPLLRPVAEEAASKWVFKPTLLNGIPMKTQGTLTFVFTQP